MAPSCSPASTDLSLPHVTFELIRAILGIPRTAVQSAGAISERGRDNLFRVCWERRVTGYPNSSTV